MFQFLKKKEAVKEVCLYAVGKGKTIPLDSVPDKTFAEKLLGDGIGFVFEDDTIYAPCDGKIMMIAKTNHAIGLRAENGAELLIHVGMDTVNLNGKGLEPLVSCNAVVKKGAALIRVDRRFMEEKGIDLTTPVILTNEQDYMLIKEKENNDVDRNDCVLRIMKR